MYIPNLWNFFFIKNTLNTNNRTFTHAAYFFSPIYFFSVPFNLFFGFWSYSAVARTFALNLFYKNNSTRTFWTQMLKTFYSFTKIFFKKLKFRGKGYYIYKNKRNTIALQFNFSHIRRLYNFFVRVKFLSKTSIIFFGSTTSSLSNPAKSFISVRPINIFTGKGVRFTRQIIYRKTGKVSSYR